VGVTKPSLEDDAAALARVLASLPQFVLVVDRDHVIRYINHVEPGYDRDEVIGTTAASVLGPESYALFDRTLGVVLTTGEPQMYEMQIALPDGSLAWYRARMFPYREGDELVGGVIVSRNVTAEKAAEEEVARLRGLLPICSWCGRIRADDGTWESVTEYLEREGDSKVTHGLCPDCSELHFNEGEGASTA
jgi:PAS domain S-box-containing protein